MKCLTIKMYWLNISVIGALIGKQKGRNIEVMNSFELKFEFVDKDIIINQEYYTTKEQQCTFEDYLLV